MYLPTTVFILVAIERKKNIVTLLKQHNQKLYEEIEK